jgi:hypothetical protein
VTVTVSRSLEAKVIIRDDRGPLVQELSRPSLGG